MVIIKRAVTYSHSFCRVDRFTSHEKNVQQRNCLAYKEVPFHQRLQNDLESPCQCFIGGCYGLYHEHTTIIILQ